MNTKIVEYLIYEKLSNLVIKREKEFGIKTNEIIFDEEKIVKESYNTPDYLLSINNKNIIVELTTASDLESGNKREFGSYKEPKFCDFEIPDLVSLRICNKIKENLDKVDDFNHPIILILCGSNNSSFIDKWHLKSFVETEPANARYVLKNTPKNELISAIFWCKLSNNLDRILEVDKFIHKGAKNKIKVTAVIKIKNLLEQSLVQAYDYQKSIIPQ